MRFFVIDGLDGSGKDTQAFKLKEYLSQDGKETILRIHPSSDNFLGRSSKRFLMKHGQFSRMAATLFYGFDVVRSVMLYCRGERNVIFVRYTLACAYLPRGVIKPVYSIVRLILPVSDDMFFIDVAPTEALRRIHLRGDEREMFETLPHLEKNRSRALLILGDWKVIDGNPGPDEVFAQIMEKISNNK
jgi:dTMP kinase